MPFRFPRLLPALALTGASLLPLSVSASAGDRCEGTLCDLYYEHVASPQPPAAAATAAPAQAAPGRPVPATNPNDGLLGHLFSSGATQPAPTGTAPAPAKRPLVAVGGGGVIGMMNGTAPSRCTGTLCDFFYGGPPPEAPAVTPSEAAVAAQPASDEAVEPQARSRLEEAPSEAETRSGCAVDSHDPWRCYRR